MALCLGTGLSAQPNSGVACISVHSTEIHSSFKLDGFPGSNVMIIGKKKVLGEGGIAMLMLSPCGQSECVIL